jgi:hypothetical protein
MIGGKMKKYILLVTCILGVTLTWAKPDVDFKSFNKSVNENIDQTIQDNPQMYETAPIGRKPASVNYIEPESTDKLDAIDEHADSHIKW